MKTDQLTSFLFALAVIVLLASLFGTGARRLGQPAVIGEIVLGVLLGPTLFSGVISDALFPAGIRPFLSALANVGVALFMFTVGLEFDRRLLRGRRVIAASVASGSIVLPFSLGVALAFYLVQRHPTENRTAFVLFMGAAMSVTAFPVLARILTDRGLARTWLGAVALACAAIDDVLAWTLLAVVVAISGSAGGFDLMLLLAVPYLVAMALVVRPALRWLLGKRRLTGPTSAVPIVVILVGLLLSAAFTEWIGLHFIFGAFLFGAVMPREEAGENGPGDEATNSPSVVAERLKQLNGVLLLPIFFIVAGLNVDLSDLDAAGLLELLLILVAAIGGKFLGAFAGARLNKMRSRPAAALAVLMNTRGLTELIILSVGLQLGVLDGELYSYMVVMALVTTMMAGPLLQRIYPLRRVDPQDPPPAETVSASPAAIAEPSGGADSKRD